MFTILVVDDDEVTRRTLQRELPFETRTASNLVEALELATRWPPSVVLVDLYLSPAEPSGVEAVHLFKQVAPRSHVIVMSSSGNDDARKWALEEGAFSFCDGKGWRVLLAAALAAIATASVYLLPGPWTVQ